MARKDKENRILARRLDMVRPKMFGDQFAYEEQQCPGCGRWRPKFNNDRMYDHQGPSTFTECAECRGVKKP